jgi:hypothetical protein
MKKIIVITFIGMLGAVTLGSCKKEYKCECTFTSNTSSDSSTTIYPMKGKKKQVRKDCENSYNYTTLATCKLK